jgi:hypothetical protein
VGIAVLRGFGRRDQYLSTTLLRADVWRSCLPRPFTAYEVIERVGNFKVLDQAEEYVYEAAISITVSSLEVNRAILSVENDWDAFEWQFSSMGQVRSSFLPFLSSMKIPKVSEGSNPLLPSLPYGFGDACWMQLLQPFISVKELNWLPLSRVPCGCCRGLPGKV